jgi:phage terminase large subunit GpA-like protein
VKLSVWSDKEQLAWAPPPDMPVSGHADRFRYVPYGAEPGPWQTSRAPYTRSIMDAYSDPEVEEITILGPAQCGKTESVFNMLCYTVDVDPVATMYVIAIDAEVPTISTDRLLPNFQKSPQLATHLTGKAWDIKQSMFRFDRMPLYFTGAGSASTLASKAIGRLFLDETDKYDDFVGNEGHPAKLAYRRGTTFGDFKVVYLCTPTATDGFIHVSWNKSNRMKYHVPCRHCGGYQVLQFGRLKCYNQDAKEPDAILSNGVYYECEVCAGKIEPSNQPWMLANGVWVPQGCRVANDKSLIGKPNRSKRHSGFWIT